MPFLDLRSDQRQGQTLSPRLQHAVRLLQMSSLDFSAMVRELLGKNPFLEGDEPDSDEGDRDSLNRPLAATGERASTAELGLAEAPVDGTMVEAGVTADLDGVSDRELWQGEGGASGPRSEDGEVSALDLVTADTPLNAHLHGQLNLLPIPHRDLILARTIVESLDDDGYLRAPLEDLVGVSEVCPQETLDELQIALKLVQSLDPAGVGARSVAECLLLQVPGIDCPEMQSLVKTVITDHLKALAAHDVTGMARHIGQSVSRMDEVCERIRRMNPRPGWSFGSNHVDYVVPDVMAKKVRGQWTVQLNPAVIPKVRLNQVYAQLFQRHRPAYSGEMGAHLQEARWTVRNVEQRFATILEVAQAIVKRQANFLDYGAMAMKPLGLREIAEEVGIHESTVSRVTNNKFIATPSGVFELKYFFSRAMAIGDSGTCSGTAIRGLIADIIKSETPEHPFSDAEITRQLAQQGLVVARRTVTKYRQLLKIDAVDRRRRHR